MKTQLTRRDFLQLSASLAAVGASGVGAYAAEEKIATIAGAGLPAGVAKDGDDALAAHFNNPYGLIEPPDRSALIFVDNGSNRVLKLDYATKKISVVAGTGMKGFGGDGGPAPMCLMAQPHEVRMDSKGNLYVVERDNYTVRKIDKKTGNIITIAGTPQKNGFSGDGGPAIGAQFNQPHGIAIDPLDNLYVCDVLNNRVRRVDAKTGIITTFAGNGEMAASPDEGPLNSPLYGPRSLEISRAGRIYVCLREGNSVFELDGKSGKMKRVAGNGKNGYTGDGGPAVQATFGARAPGGLTGPKGLCVSEDGRTMYVADCENHAIRRIDLRTGMISTAAGTGMRGDGPDGSDPGKCQLSRPHAVFLRNKVLYIADSENHKIRTLSPA